MKIDGRGRVLGRDTRGSTSQGQGRVNESDRVSRKHQSPAVPHGQNLERRDAHTDDRAEKYDGQCRYLLVIVLCCGALCFYATGYERGRLSLSVWLSAKLALPYAPTVSRLLPPARAKDVFDVDCSRGFAILRLFVVKD